MDLLGGHSSVSNTNRRRNCSLLGRGIESKNPLSDLAILKCLFSFNNTARAEIDLSKAVWVLFKL